MKDLEKISSFGYFRNTNVVGNPASELSAMKKAKFTVVFIFLSFLLGNCFNIAGDCETIVTYRLLNPSKTLQAVISQTDCGATTTPSSGLRIIENADTLDVGSPENTVLGSNGGFDFYWLSDDTLVVKGADTTSGFTMKNRYTLTKRPGKVIILYQR